MLNTPILFLIFNRPETTALVFEQIRIAKPKQLFIAADGPRTDKENDEFNCELVRKLVLDGVDWPCEVKTLFRGQNLGCGKAVSKAITWFFEHVEQGIILEDDCLPNQDFFHFCNDLLNKYVNDDKVASISGTNLLGQSTLKKKESYFFGHGGIWGWATWKRAWDLYDFDMRIYSEPNTQLKIKQNIADINWYNFYFPLFDSTFKEQIDTWDAQWFFAILINDKLSINPTSNLVKNIGFNSQGTHTTDGGKISTLKNYSLKFPLVHPIDKVINVKYLKQSYRYLNKKNYFITLIKKTIGRLTKLHFKK